jgi:large conductance mechanosensitive channel
MQMKQHADKRAFRRNVMQILREFRTFALKGNILDMAVGVILGSAFSGLVKSMVDDLLMPPVGLLLGGVDFSNVFVTLKQGGLSGPYSTLAAARQAGAVTLNLGLFINTIISFGIVSTAAFILVRSVNTLREKLELAPDAVPAIITKECPRCFSKVHHLATRCPACTSDI